MANSVLHDSSFGYTVATTGSPPNVANATDQNKATSSGQTTGSSYVSITREYSWTITLGKAVHVDSIVIKLLLQTLDSREDKRWRTIKLIKSDLSEVVLLNDYNRDTYGTANKNYLLDTTYNNGSAGWDDIEKIYVYAKIEAYSGYSGAVAGCGIHLYEVDGFGVIYDESPFKLRNGATSVTLAMLDATATSPLRFKIGSTVKQLVLVDVTDANASALRIKTDSGIKAIAKMPT